VVGIVVCKSAKSWRIGQHCDFIPRVDTRPFRSWLDFIARGSVPAKILHNNGEPPETADGDGDGAMRARLRSSAEAEGDASVARPPATESAAGERQRQRESHQSREWRRRRRNRRWQRP
jgi:hypothetical protein